MAAHWDKRRQDEYVDYELYLPDLPFGVGGLLRLTHDTERMRWSVSLRLDTVDGEDVLERAITCNDSENAILNARQAVDEDVASLNYWEGVLNPLEYRDKDER